MNPGPNPPLKTWIAVSSRLMRQTPLFRKLSAHHGIGGHVLIGLVGERRAEASLEVGGDQLARASTWSHCR